MKCKTNGNKIIIDVDESTRLEYDIEDLKEKVNNIPVAYMSSEENDALIQQLKDENLI